MNPFDRSTAMGSALADGFRTLFELVLITVTILLWSVIIAFLLLAAPWLLVVLAVIAAVVVRASWMVRRDQEQAAMFDQMTGPLDEAGMPIRGGAGACAGCGPDCGCARSDCGCNPGARCGCGPDCRCQQAGAECSPNCGCQTGSESPRV